MQDSQRLNVWNILPDHKFINITLPYTLKRPRYFQIVAI